MLPSIWGSRVAFVRVYERRRGRRGWLPYVYVGFTRARGATTRVRGGTRGRYDRYLAGRRVRYDGGPGPLVLELRGRRLAFPWAYRGCFTPGDRIGEVSANELWVATVGRQPRRL